NESGLGRADRPAQSATDSVPAGRANRQAGADTQCRRLSFVGWSLRICFSFKAGQWRAKRRANRGSLRACGPRRLYGVYSRGPGRFRKRDCPYLPYYQASPAPKILLMYQCPTTAKRQVEDRPKRSIRAVAAALLVRTISQSTFWVATAFRRR